MTGKLTAAWTSDLKRVEVFSNGLHISNVCLTPNLGWRVYPLSSTRFPSRKHHVDPATAIKAYYGKLVKITSPTVVRCNQCHLPIEGTRKVGDDLYRDEAGFVVAKPVMNGYVHTVCPRVFPVANLSPAPPTGVNRWKCCRNLFDAKGGGNG